MNWNKFINESVDFISNYLIDNHLESMVLGISGGIDSTIAAVLCSIAAKKTNTKLIGVSLMCSTNKQDECSVADLVGQAFCNEYYKENIQEPYEAISKFCINSSAIKGMSTKISEGNIKARLRMIYLWNLSGFRNGVTIDTGNKTEHELGFFTLMGDQNYLNPGLYYLWKTEIYELAEYLKEYYCNGYIDSKNNPYDEIEVTEDWFNKYEAIRDSINLTPTDGNGVSNSDCEQFGLENYEQVDDVLKAIYYNKVKNDYSNNSEYLRLIDSYNEQGVDKVIELHQNTAYKRQDLPAKPILSKLDFAKIGKVLTTLRKECLAYLRNIVSKHNNSYEFDNDSMVTVSYDGGNHPEYASNVYSQVHRIYIKDNKLLFDIDDEYGYSEDRITTYELYSIASYIYYSL